MENDDIREELPFFDASAAIYRLAGDLLARAPLPEFQRRARELAAGIEVEDLDDLRFKFHNPPKEPPDYDFRKHGLGGWLSACQFAIFELVFQLKAEALPFLREIAWGPYDWTQGNAIELLIRLAAEGVETSGIVSEIAENFPGIRHEAQLYALEPLLPMAQSDPALADLLTRMREQIPILDKTAVDIEARVSSDR